MSARNEIRQIMLRRHHAARMGQPVTNAVLVGTLEEAADLLDAARGERDAALARVARLERVLAVERGDASQAPSGWRREHPGTEWNHGDAHVWRLTTGRWRWVRPGAPNDADRCRFDFALEAMEAADAAGEVKP